MQMVKNVLLSREKTLSRKLQELFLTWYVEHHLTKERIMEIYFNVIEFGPGIYGIGRAARHYFGKTRQGAGAARGGVVLVDPAQSEEALRAVLPRERHARRQVGRVHQAHHAAHARARPAHRRGIRARDRDAAEVLAREAMPERECMALVKRITTPPQQLAQQSAK